MLMDFKNSVQDIDGHQGGSDAPRMVIVCQWEDALAGIPEFFYDLLVFLDDAATAQHRVIIQTQSGVEQTRILLGLASSLAQSRGMPVTQDPSFEILSLEDIKNAGIKADILFYYRHDNLPVCVNPLVPARLKIGVDKGFGLAVEEEDLRRFREEYLSRLGQQGDNSHFLLTKSLDLA